MTVVSPTASVSDCRAGVRVRAVAGVASAADGEVTAADTSHPTNFEARPLTKGPPVHCWRRDGRVAANPRRAASVSGLSSTCTVQ